MQFGPPKEKKATCREKYEYRTAGEGGPLERLKLWRQGGTGEYSYVRTGACPAWSGGTTCTTEMRGRRYKSKAQLRRRLGWLRTIETRESGSEGEGEREGAAAGANEGVTYLHPDGPVEEVLELPVSLPPMSPGMWRLYAPALGAKRTLPSPSSRSEAESAADSIDGF